MIMARGIAEDEILGWTLPLLHKRWLVALYNISIGTCLVLPVAIDR